ncbi:MAG: FAD:protein FMN transferase [Bacteroidales bacterium]|nr:FAD:protein FMN transferase [Bacteroidales bacterium]
MKSGPFILLVLLAGLAWPSSCNPASDAEYLYLQGFTQGTTYHLTCQHPGEQNLKEQIDSVLKVFDASLNSYDSTSIISAINRNETGVKTDSLFRTVFRESGRVYQVTGGAFDITLAPLIDAWGFGPGEKQDLDSALVDSLLQYVGMDKVFLYGDQVRKANPHVKLNVNAIAQGYAVDVVSAYLEGLGCKNYMVEIGGEIRTRGVNEKGNFWRIGVDRPEFGNMIPGEQLQVIISMHNRSLATSGNYRKFYEKEGVKITHSIDPLTGYPEASSLLSVTILADECMTADAYATACMVLGLEKARDFVRDQKGVDAYFIYGDEIGAYQVWFTDGMKKYIELP